MSLGGAEALLAAAFLFATTNVLVREMSHMWGDHAQIAARFAVVWLILVIFMRMKGQKVSIPRSKRLLAVSYSLLASVAILFFVLSVQMTTIANTLFTSSAIELVAAFLLGTLLLNEKVTGKKFLAIGLSLAGLVLYSGALLSGDAGIIFGLLAGVTTAFCNIIAKKLKGVNLTAILRMQFGVGTILMILLTLLFSPNDIVRTVSVEGMLITIVFALVLILATHLVLYGFQHFDVNIASVILSSQLVFGALLGYFLYQEVLTTNELISGILIACAAVVGSIAYKRSPKEIDVHS